MSNKNIIIVIVFLLLAGFGLWIFIANKTASIPSENLGTEFPDGGPSGTQNPDGTPSSNAGDKSLILKTTSGATLTVRNFIIDSDTVADPQNEGYYHLGEHFPLDGSPVETYPPFAIMYVAQTQYFNISLTSEPISKARSDAEQYLLTHLGLSEEQLCQIDYMVSVPYFINQFYTSQDLRFSFCPGSVPL